MNFLTPIFFLGMVAVAIPILIHLSQLQKKDQVDFPSLMFLRKIPYRSVRRQKLRHLLLFLLRCLVICLLVVAFSRPFLKTSEMYIGKALVKKAVILLLDNSYSMGYENRLEDAKQEARSLISNLEMDTPISLVVFSEKAEVLVKETTNIDMLVDAINKIQLSSETTHYASALELTDAIITESVFSSTEVVLLSDFQRNGWDGSEEIWLSEGVMLTPIDLGMKDPTNFAITKVTFTSHEIQRRNGIKAFARVSYEAPKGNPSKTISVSMEINSRLIQSTSVDIFPNTSAVVSFDSFSLPEGSSRGTVRLGEDMLVTDNVFHFVIRPRQKLSVLILDGSQGESFYLERALSVGEQPTFRVERVNNENFSSTELYGRSVVILNGIRLLNNSDGELLKDFVVKGGGLLIILNEQEDKNELQSHSWGLLPQQIGLMAERSLSGSGRLEYLDYQSPVFEMFSSPYAGDFSVAKFFRYITFEETAEDRVLARFDDGTAALVEKSIGEGRVLIWTSSLDTSDNDLALQPVFLPFVHQLVEHTATSKVPDSWYTVSETADLNHYLENSGIVPDISANGIEQDIVVLSPSGARSLVPMTKKRTLLSIGEQGFYEIRLQGVKTPVVQSTSIAVNLDVMESDLSVMDPEELVASVSFGDRGGLKFIDSNLTGAEKENRKEFWWYLLVGVFLLLVAETAMSNRLTRTRNLFAVKSLSREKLTK